MIKVAARRGEIDFMPVEAATALGTLEITVSKFELLRELTATQGVVERKTTIPILSNAKVAHTPTNFSKPGTIL